MKTAMTLSDVLSITVLLVLWTECACDDYDEDNVDSEGTVYIRGRRSYSYDYGGGVGLMQDYGSESVQRPEPPPPLVCYSCNLVVINNVKQGGYEQCGERFYRGPLQLDTAVCNGPCATVFHRMDEVSYHISRNCLPSCQQHTSDKFYMQCCTTDYCNGSTATRTQASNWLVSRFRTVAAVTVALLCQCLLSTCYTRR